MMTEREATKWRTDIEKRMGGQERITSRLSSRADVAEDNEAEEFLRATTLILLDSTYPPSGRSSGDIGIVTGGSSIYEGDTFKVNSDEDEWIPFHHWKATTKAGLPAAAAGVEISHIAMVTAGTEAGRHYVRNAANTEWDCISHWEE